MNGKLIMFFLFIIMPWLVFGQKSNKGNDRFQQKEPKENINVIKEYDEQGNLTRYDSIYTYSYSTIGSDSMQNLINISPFGNDSVLEPWMPSIDSFFNNSLHKWADFDFYSGNYFNNSFFADSIFLKMDSLRKHFLLDFDRMEDFQDFY